MDDNTRGGHDRTAQCIDGAELDMGAVKRRWRLGF
jgi:hypothetical protein